MNETDEEINLLSYAIFDSSDRLHHTLHFNFAFFTQNRRLKVVLSLDCNTALLFALNG